MKRIKTFTFLAILLFFCFTQILFGQEKYVKTFTSYPNVSIGYHYLGDSYLQLGGGTSLKHKSGYTIPISLDANISYLGDDFIFLPELNIGVMFNFKEKGNPYSSNLTSNFWVFRTGFSTHYIEPKFGITLLEIMEIYGGYLIHLNDYKEVKPEGVSFGLRLNIPTLLFSKN